MSDPLTTHSTHSTHPTHDGAVGDPPSTDPADTTPTGPEAALPVETPLAAVKLGVASQYVDGWHRRQVMTLLEQAEKLLTIAERVPTPSRPI